MKFIFFILAIFSFLYSTDNRYEDGKKIYLKTCISCHSPDGTASSGLKFVVSPRNLHETILTEEQSYNIIKDGAHFWGSASDIMPSFKSLLDEEELRNVAHYVSQEFNPEIKSKIDKLYEKSEKITEDKISKMPKIGKKIYNRNCSWCHGITGKGDGEASRNPELSIFPYDLTKALLDEKQMFLYVKYGGQHWGTYKDDMPSWSKKYDDFTIKSVVGYIFDELRQSDEKK